jgi:hypothetical protein
MHAFQPLPIQTRAEQADGNAGNANRRAQCRPASRATWAPLLVQTCSDLHSRPVCTTRLCLRGAGARTSSRKGTGLAAKRPHGGAERGRRRHVKPSAVTQVGANATNASRPVGNGAVLQGRSLSQTGARRSNTTEHKAKEQKSASRQQHSRARSTQGRPGWDECGLEVMPCSCSTDALLAKPEP